MRAPCVADRPEWEQIEALFRAGMPASRIAWAVGRTDTCIRDRLKVLGLLSPPRDRIAFACLSREDLAAMRARGLTHAAIGQAFGVSERWAGARCRALDLRGRCPRVSCRHGHALTAENLDLNRRCLACRRRQERERYQARKGGAR